MALYEPLRDAFNEMNRMFIDRQEWQAEHERRKENDAWKRQMQQQDMETQAMQNTVLAHKVAKVQHLREPIGLNQRDIINIQDPEVGQWWEANKQDTAVNFTNDPYAGWDQNGDLVTGDGNKYIAPRETYFPKMGGHLFKLSSDVDPIAIHQETYNELKAMRDDTQESLDMINAAGLDSKFVSKHAELKTKLANIKKDMRPLEAKMFKHDNREFLDDGTKNPNFEKLAKDAQGNPIMTKKFMLSQLDEKEEAINDTYANLLTAGMDQAGLSKTYETAMNGIAADRARIENKETALERAYGEYLVTTGLTPAQMPLHEFKMDYWDGKTGSNNFKTAYAEWKAMGFPGAPTNAQGKIANKDKSMAFFKTEIWEKANDLTPNKLLDHVFQGLLNAPDARRALKAKGVGTVEIAATVEALAEQKKISRMEAFLIVMGNVKEQGGNWTPSSTLAKTPVAKKAAVKADTQAPVQTSTVLSRRESDALGIKIKRGVSNGAIPTTMRNGREAVRHAPSDTWFVKNDNGNFIPESLLKTKKKARKPMSGAEFRRRHELR